MDGCFTRDNRYHANARTSFIADGYLSPVDDKWARKYGSFTDDSTKIIKVHSIFSASGMYLDDEVRAFFHSKSYIK